LGISHLAASKNIRKQTMPFVGRGIPDAPQGIHSNIKAHQGKQSKH